MRLVNGVDEVPSGALLLSSQVDAAFHGPAVYLSTEEALGMQFD